MCIEVTAEDKQRRCRRDVWQTVPDASGGDRKSSAAQGGRSANMTRTDDDFCNLLTFALTEQSKAEDTENKLARQWTSV